MALSDNMRLYDIATRGQVYIEGVKVQYAREFNFVLAELRLEISRILARVKYKTLDGLTKAELNKLVVTLRESQSRIYSAYTQQILKQLKDFMRADLEMNRRAYVYAKFEFDEERYGKPQIPSDARAIKFLKEENNQANFIPLFGLAAITGNNDRLWSAVTNAPIPANGLYLVPFVKTFAVSAQASVENTIRKAWANGWTIEETLQEITGEDNKQGTSSQLQRVGVQASAVVATAVQHVAAITGAAVMSALFGWYGWYSVMDGKTTEICISRNRKRYRFGQGPIPPAHIRCRSHIAPIVGTDDIAAESFYTWAIRQPADVQNDILGEDVADELRNGNLKQSDLPKFESRQALTLDEFRRKINEVLSR
jgi:hypothetical protein